VFTRDRALVVVFSQAAQAGTIRDLDGIEYRNFVRLWIVRNARPRGDPDTLHAMGSLVLFDKGCCAMVAQNQQL